MCYKKDHLDPDTIETIPLKGGVCDEKRSVRDMQNDGYKVEDIRISNGIEGLNYTYIFIKDSSTKKSIPKSAKLEINDKVDIKAGEKLYNKTCVTCHGDGTISAYNAARPLATLSVEQIEESIRDYGLDEKDNGMAILMKPYANSLIDEDIVNVAAYIQTLGK